MTDSAARLWLAQMGLRLRAGAQRRAFRALAEEFAPLYRDLARHDIARFVTPLWERFNADLERALLPRPPWAFLRNSTIKRTMFVDARGPWLQSQVAELRAALGEAGAALAADEPVGDPPLAVAAWRASHNSIHHLTHLIRHRAATGLDRPPPAIVEWGGGYGNLARIIRRLAAGPVTYTIIDTPLLAALQRTFLATIFGPEAVHTIRNPGDRPREGAFNILPVGLIEHIQPRADLFISTWALSESSPFAQDWVAAHWFGASSLLLAFQESSAELPHAGRLRALAEHAGAQVIPFPELPGNSYAFR